MKAVTFCLTVPKGTSLRRFAGILSSRISARLTCLRWIGYICSALAANTRTTLVLELYSPHRGERQEGNRYA
jgi:hypothetical protein